jgi:hypothetical protein
MLLPVSQDLWWTVWIGPFGTPPFLRVTPYLMLSLSSMIQGRTSQNTSSSFSNLGNVPSLVYSTRLMDDLKTKMCFVTLHSEKDGKARASTDIILSLRWRLCPLPKFPFACD